MQFGTDSYCLLFVENYHHPDPSRVDYTFDAYSNSCLAALNIGGIGLCLSLLLLAARLYAHQKNIMISKQAIQILATSAAVWALVNLIMASIMSSGLRQTCSEFEKSHQTCEHVFKAGFSVNAQTGASKSLGMASSAVGACWVLFLTLAAYSAIEWYNYRRANLQWWVSVE